MSNTQLLLFEIDNSSETKKRLKQLDDAIKELDKFLPKTTLEEVLSYGNTTNP